MIQSLVKFFFKNQNQKKTNPRKLKDLLEEDARKKDFLFVVSLSDDTYIKLRDEWRHPDWTEIYKKIMGMIKKEITANEKSNKKEDHLQASYPLPPKAEEIMTIIVKYKEDKDKPKVGKYLVTEIKIEDSKLKN